jgi:hypothetical protein
MGGAKEGVNDAEWVEPKKSSPVGVKKQTFKANFLKSGVTSYFLNLPQPQCMIYTFLALSLYFYPM